MNINKLITGVKNKEQSAITKLYNDNINSIYFICKELVDNEEKVKDLSQDTFMTILNKIDTLSDNDKYYAWQKTIAINKCKDYLKKNKELLFIDEKQEESLMQVEESDDSYVPHKQIIKKETRKTIMNIINNSLSEKQRTAIILFYYNEMKYSEIAEYFECATGTVKSRINSAKNIIKAEIEKLEQKGAKVRCIGALPLLAFILQEEAKNNTISRTVKNEMLANILSGTLGSAAKTLGGILSTKLISAVIIGATITTGGIVAYSKLSDTTTEEESVMSNADDIAVDEDSDEIKTSEVSEKVEAADDKKVDGNKKEETVVVDGKEIKVKENPERDITTSTEDKPKPKTPSTPQEKPKDPPKQPQPQTQAYTYNASLSAQALKIMTNVNTNNYGETDCHAICNKKFFDQFYSIGQQYVTGQISAGTCESQIYAIDSTTYSDTWGLKHTKVNSVDCYEKTINSLSELYANGVCTSVGIFSNGTSTYKVKIVLVNTDIEGLE